MVVPHHGGAGRADISRKVVQLWDQVPPPSHQHSFLHLPSPSFTFLHLHSPSFTFIHLPSPSSTFHHLPSPYNCHFTALLCPISRYKCTWLKTSLLNYCSRHLDFPVFLKTDKFRISSHDTFDAFRNTAPGLSP